jgi:hypothetical protein
VAEDVERHRSTVMRSTGLHATAELAYDRTPALAILRPLDNRRRRFLAAKSIIDWTTVSSS